MSWINIRNLGKPIAILDEGISLTTDVSSINFTGAGVAGTAVGSAITFTMPGTIGTAIIGETPTGTVDGSNKTFTLSHTPTTGSLAVYIGIRLCETSDFSITGTTLTFVNAPDTTPSVDYTYGGSNIDMTGMFFPVSTITATTNPYNVNLSANSFLNLFDSTSGVINVQLPLASSCSGKMYAFAFKAHTETVNLLPSGADTIATAASPWNLTSDSGTVTLMSDGISNWVLVGYGS